MMPRIYDDIRKAIDASGKTRYRIWKDTGISQSRLSLFMDGHKGLSVEALEELAEYLGLEIKAVPIKKKKQTKRKKEK